METIMVERTFGEPVAFEEIQAIEDAGAWCLEAHGVTFLKTYFSRDRRRMLCLYTAPDAESVRLAERQAGVPFDRAWSCRVLRASGAAPSGPSAAPRSTVIVERLLEQPATPRVVRDMVAGAAWCMEANGVLYRTTHLSLDGRRVVCEFAGPDAEAVRRANRQGDLPVAALWPATVHLPSGPA